MRDTMDEVKLAELAESIGKIGIVEPLVVIRVGERYRVVAGHRRQIAAGLVKYSPVPCIVRDAGQIDPAAVTIAENYYREDVNPAEEAVFLEHLLETRCNGDMELLAALIRHTVAYIDDRLLLLRGDRAVLDQLKERKISLAVARELNKVKDEGRRRVYLDAAIRGGATAAVVREWRAHGDYLPATEGAPAAAASTDGQPQFIPPENMLVCFFCGDDDDPHLMELLYLHRQCKKFVQRILATGGQTPAAVEPPKAEGSV